jgi:hypothetical protein
MTRIIAIGTGEVDTHAYEASIDNAIQNLSRDGNCLKATLYKD